MGEVIYEFPKKRFFIIGGILLLLYLSYFLFFRSILAGFYVLRGTYYIGFVGLLLGFGTLILIKKVFLDSKGTYVIVFIHLATSLLISSLAIFFLPLVTIAGLIMTGLFASGSGDILGLIFFIPLFSIISLIALIIILCLWIVPIIKFKFQRKIFILLVIVLSLLFYFFVLWKVVGLLQPGARGGQYGEAANLAQAQIQEKTINVSTASNLLVSEVTIEEWNSIPGSQKTQYSAPEYHLVIKETNGRGEFSLEMDPYGVGTNVSYTREGIKVWERNGLCSVNLNPKKYFSYDYSKLAASLDIENNCGSEQVIYNSDTNQEKILETIQGGVLGWLDNDTVLLKNNEPKVSDRIDPWLWAYNISSDEFKPISLPDLSLLYYGEFTSSPNGKWILVNGWGGEIWIISIDPPIQIVLRGLPCESSDIGCEKAIWGLKESEIYLKNRDGFGEREDGTWGEIPGGIWVIKFSEDLYNFKTS